MHPEEIKAAVRMQGVTPAVIADSLGVSPSLVSRVIHGAAVSARVREHIARIVGQPVSMLWPPAARPVLRRRSCDLKPARGAV